MRTSRCAPRSGDWSHSLASGPMAGLAPPPHATRQRRTPRASGPPPRANARRHRACRQRRTPAASALRLPVARTDLTQRPTPYAGPLAPSAIRRSPQNVSHADLPISPCQRPQTPAIPTVSSNAIERSSYEPIPCHSIHRTVQVVASNTRDRARRALPRKSRKLCSNSQRPPPQLCGEEDRWFARGSAARRTGFGD